MHHKNGAENGLKRGNHACFVLTVIPGAWYKLPPFFGFAVHTLLLNHRVYFTGVITT